MSKIADFTAIWLQWPGANASKMEYLEPPEWGYTEKEPKGLRKSHHEGTQMGSINEIIIKNSETSFFLQHHFGRKEIREFMSEDTGHLILREHLVNIEHFRTYSHTVIKLFLKEQCQEIFDHFFNLKDSTWPYVNRQKRFRELFSFFSNFFVFAHIFTCKVRVVVDYANTQFFLYIRRF